MMDLSRRTEELDIAAEHCLACAIDASMSRHGRLGLDVGCGIGDTTRVVSRFVDRVIGLDASATNIDQARHQDLGHRFEFVHGCPPELHDAPELHGVMGRCDLIVASRYVRDQRTVSAVERSFEWMARHLGPDGTVALVIKNTAPWEPLWMMRLMDRWFDVEAFDVKGLLVRERRLMRWRTEPPFEVLTGRLRCGEGSSA